jgi:hypothetical protein
MIADAAGAGFYADGAGRKFPASQLLTMEVCSPANKVPGIPATRRI